MRAVMLAKNPAAWLFEGSMDVFEKRPFKDPHTKATVPGKEVKVLEDIPCRISFDSFPSSDSSTGLPTAERAVKLFCGPDIDVSPGSKIVVTQDGITETYSYSGTAAKYCSHTEINLKRWEGWV